MAFILSIETSTRICSVAIHENGELLASQKLMQEKSHSGLLTVLIADILKYCSLKVDDLNAVAVAEGPGSYTGLRIGVSTAKGLCFAADLPLIAVNSLEAMAFHANNYNFNKAFLCPVIDARRMEVYCMLLDSDLNIMKKTSSFIFSEDIFLEFSDGNPLLVFGDGAQKFSELIASNPKVNLVPEIQPLADFLGHLAYRKYLSHEFVDLAYFEPFYLKDFRTTKPKQV